ncbi:hypothetical protein J2752_000657 [Halarchaeum rubridurum]|uniref:Uncharacterized protein n=1 Tax=Halarchaeum rubridurum TaxID=489911 RepID=A0A830FSJ1_9EURY|nr:hypothetical protein [Halarchaeum rubridurum]MBP1953776.1 hypothetical protein [Halarchaeum rubridurum]GGM54607.1 hypothetical protein GCM10009017_01160 [Halarchaeum rubridurum]
MRHTRALAACCLVVLVALAGCSALSGPQGASDDATTAQPYETPLNGTQIDQQHAATIRDAGSFTYRLQSSASYASGQSASRLTAVRADLDTGAYSLRIVQGPQDSQVYVGPNGTAYTRITTGNRTAFAQGALRSANASAYVSPGVASLTERADFTYEGTTEFDGSTLHTYVAHPATLPIANTSAFGNASEANVTVRLGITSDGVVERQQFHVATERATLDSTRTYTEIGSTDPTPAWLSQAEQRFANETASNETTTNGTSTTTNETTTTTTTSTNETTA